MTIPIYRVTKLSGDNERPVNYSNRLLSIDLTDEPGADNDVLTFTLDNSRPHIPSPPNGTKFSLELGYKEDGLINMGTYVVNEFTMKGDKTSGHTIEVKCNSNDVDADNKEKFNIPKTENWLDTTVGEMVTIMAEDAGYKAVVSPKYFNITVAYEQQNNITDAALLTKLKKLYNAEDKTADGNYYFMEKGSNIKASTGLATSVPKIALSGKDILSYSLTITPAKETKRVKVNYKDFDGDKTITIGDPSFTGVPKVLGKEVFDTKAKALEAGRSYLADQRRLGTDFDLELIGNPGIQSQITVLIYDFVPELEGVWIIQKVKHSITKSGGYITTCSTAKDDAETVNDYREIDNSDDDDSEE